MQSDLVIVSYYVISCMFGINTMFLIAKLFVKRDWSILMPTISRLFISLVYFYFATSPKLSMVDRADWVRTSFLVLALSELVTHAVGVIEVFIKNRSWQRKKGRR